MKVFGRGGLFNVTNRTQPMGNSTVHIIEGNIEVKRNGEQGVDIYKFQIESFSQKQIDYRSGKFIQGAGIMFCGDLHGGVIKIKGDADLISNNHFFNDNTKAMMNAPVQQQQQQQQQPNNYYGGFSTQQQQQQQQQQQSAQPQNNYYGGFVTPAQQQVPTQAQQPIQQQFNTTQPVEQQTNFYGGYGTQQTQPTQQVQQQVPPPAQQQVQQQNNTPAFASPAVNAMPQANGEPQQTQQVNYADLFANNQNK